MKKTFLIFMLTVLSVSIALGQLSITSTSTYTIDFDNSVSGVNNGGFDTTAGASYLDSNPSPGQLDADAWSCSQTSGSAASFPGSGTAVYATCTSDSPGTSGGLFAYNISTLTNRMIGFSPTGSLFTPGNITLKIVNNTGSTINQLSVEYIVYAYNNQPRANTVDFWHSSDNTTYTNGNLTFTSTAASTNNWESATKTITITGLTIADNSPYYLQWRLDDAGGSGSRDKFALDNIKITAAMGGNTPPSISNIVQTPSTDIINTTTVSVSATITDSDGTVTSAQLRWGTATGVYGNTIGMTASGSTYTTNSNIPAQTAGTTVYYVIDATDDDSDTTTSSEQSYTVIAPATTTIPYTEDFSNGWGDTYRYDIAGTKPWYIFNNDNASCNGYGSNLEEHWLVLPGINFNNYSNERMTFNTIATYGTIDANNYLKLLYSNNYPGLGDPTSSTWTEIAFANGGIGGGETSSGVLDLSGISGTNVYLAFKYYSTNQPTRWEIDDINIYLATPLITVNPTTLTGFTYQGTGPSTAQTFTVSGTDLTADIVLTAPTNYEISLSETTGYTSSLTLTAAKLGVAETTIYVRLKAGLSVGNYNNEVITASSTGATSKTVTCDGSVTSPPPPNAPNATAATNQTSNGFTANWDAVSSATGYNLDVYTKTTEDNASDLFISEYVEGSSNNKGIEIYNGTGASVDLSSYSLKQYNNGATTPTYTLTLSGSLTNGSVYRIVNSNQTIFGTNYDLSTNSSVMGFNGNDAVAIFKGTDLVDVVGPIGNASDWGKDVTLVRKEAASVPSAIYSATDWDSYASDTITNWGSHTFNGVSTNTFVIGYQNLDVGNVTSYNVTGLQPGITYYYVVRAYNAYGTSANSNEISAQTLAPTPVVLSSFTCTLTSDMYVNLNWVTQSETGMRGFYVLRGEQNSQQQAQIISPLINATNQSQTQVYSYRDSEYLIDGTTYYYWLSMVELDGSSTVHGPVTVFYQSVSTPPVIPTVTALNNVYPNPFNPVAFIPYSIEKGRTDQVRIHVYNSRGQIVRTLIDKPHTEGNYQLQWDGRDTNGNECATGVYFVRMTVGKDSFLRKAVLVK